MTTDTIERVSAAEWPLYAGTKLLKATPMTRGQYNAFRGWDMPPGEDCNDPGYTVEYQDRLGQPNIAGFEGYVSWSPANVFEATYRPAVTPLDRIGIELAELDARTDKLYAFISTQQFAELPELQRDLLVAQFSVMQGYQRVLAARANHMKDTPPNG